jgi:Glu-tRNA(Gln) amidotransferase subunit E-like FAD-binding protein
MSLDYNKLGLKSGLEIHQQLNTGKLFCNCPSVLRSDNPEFEINRKLHAVAGELGEIDEAVAHEHSLKKDFVYQGYGTTCLVELDEAPPKQINQDSLRVALQIAILLNCEIIPVTQIMRKTVIDGSNTGGFQRTLLFAKDGYVETSQGKVGIDAVFLEEDSARLIERKKDKTIFRLDRLGIPLVEIATNPDIKNAEHAKETALKIGEILRACDVRRGIGTIRQDINISMNGGKRVEIKGFQDPKVMVKTFEKEVMRQKKLVDSKSGWNAEVRNALPDGTTEFLRPMPGPNRMYPETDLPLLKISRNFVNDIKNNLPKLKHEIKSELKSSGLNDEMMNLILKSGKLDDFKNLSEMIEDSNLVAKMLVLWPKEFSKKLNKNIEEVQGLLNEDVLEFVLDKFSNNEIEKNEIPEILFDVAKGMNIKDVLEKEKVSLDNVEEFIIKLIKDKPGLKANAYMGLVMKEFNGQVSGKQVMDLIKKYVE